MNQKLLDKFNFLNTIMRNGTYPRGTDFLGPGSGTFYQCVMSSVLPLRLMNRRTKKNKKEWDFHIQRIEKLVDIAKKQLHFLDYHGIFLLKK